MVPKRDIKTEKKERKVIITKKGIEEYLPILWSELR
jgi:hypothetical protein